MKLLLRRDQRTSTFGKAIFMLGVRAQLSDEEKSNIQRYRLGKTLLYEKPYNPEQGLIKGLMSGLPSSLAVSDLEDGKHFECKDILEMMAIESGLKEAATTFAAVLEFAAKFGGEEVVEL